MVTAKTAHLVLLWCPSISIKIMNQLFRKWTQNIWISWHQDIHIKGKDSKKRKESQGHIFSYWWLKGGIPGMKHGGGGLQSVDIVAVYVCTFTGLVWQEAGLEGKSVRSKYWQIAMLSAMATACTTCHRRDAIKVKCAQHLDDTNICNNPKIVSLFQHLSNCSSSLIRFQWIAMDVRL